MLVICNHLLGIKRKGTGSKYLRWDCLWVVCVIAGSILQESYIKQKKELEKVEQIENLLKMAEKLKKN